MTKRIIALVSTLLMLVNTCVSAEVANRDYELLYNLDIVSEMYDTYEKKNNITQKEFISSLVAIVTEEEIPEEQILEYAQSRNIISSVDSSELESAIQYERALSLTLNTLGYAKVIAYDGQNIEAVRKYANECELTKGISLNFGDNLDGKSMITLLSNALEADMLNAVMSDKAGIFERSDKNPLEAYREIEEISGQITHTSYTSLYEEKGVGANRIGIDDVIYDIGYAYPEELLGQTVKAYVREDVVFHVQPRSSELRKIEIEGEDIISISDDFTNIEYEEGKRTEDIDLNPALTVIYNGKNYKDYTKEDLIPTDGKIVCVDTDSDKKYDIVFVYSYEVMVVKNVSTAYEIIGNVYDLPGHTQTLDFKDNYLDVKIYKNGEEVRLSSLEVNNVLSVAKSKGDEPVLRIYVGTESVNGTIYRLDKREAIVKVGEVEYEVNRSYFDTVDADDSKIDEMELGNAYTFFFDAFGKIAYVKQDKLDGYEYVLLFKQRWDTTEDVAKVRVLNVNDEWEDLYYAEKVKLNDQNKLKAEVVFDQMSGKELEPKIVLIKRDAEGKISAIREAKQSNEYGAKGFTKTSEQHRYYWTGDSSFNCRHYLKYDAFVLLKPNDESGKFDEEQYQFANVSYFADWKDYYYVAYNVDEFGFPELFEVKDTRSNTGATLYINKIVHTLNEYGEPTRLITGNLKGIENLSLFEIPGAVTSSFKEGDIADVTLRNGKIVDVKVTYSAGRDKEYKLPVDNGDIHGGAIQVMGDVVGIDVERSMLLVNCGTEVLPVFIHSQAEIEIYDENEKKYIIGSISDIYEGNYVRITMGSNQVNAVVVFH